MTIEEFIDKSNKLKDAVKKHSEEGNLALIGQDMIQNTELLEEISSYRASLLIELNDIKEAKREEVDQIAKQLAEVKGRYAQIITEKNNALITITSEFKSLKSLQNLLKLQGSNIKYAG